MWILNLLKIITKGVFERILLNQKLKSPKTEEASVGDSMYDLLGGGIGGTF